MGVPFIEQRNQRFLLMQGIFFLAGIAFVDTNTVVPLFIERFTGRTELAGAAATLRLSTSLIVQFVIGLAVPRIRNLPRYLSVVMLVGYGLPLLMVPVLLFSSHAPFLSVALLAIVGLFWMADGAVVIGWYDLFGRTVPAGRRGRVLGLLQLFGGIGSVAAALLIKAILDAGALAPRTQFLLIFLCGGLILLLSSSMMLFTRDGERRTSVRGGLMMSLRRIPGIWAGNARYRSLALVQVFFTLAIMCIPLLLLFCKNVFVLPPHLVTWLIGIQVAGTLVGGLAAALVSPRWGNAVLVGLFAGVAFGVPAAGIAALLLFPGSPGAWPLLAALMFLSGVAGAAWIGFANRTIDILLPEDLAPGMAAVSLLSIPLSFAPYGAGLIAGRAGFGALLAACAIMGAAAFVTAAMVPAALPAEDTTAAETAKRAER